MHIDGLSNQLPKLARNCQFINAAHILHVEPHKIKEKLVVSS